MQLLSELIPANINISGFVKSGWDMNNGAPFLFEHDKLNDEGKFRS